MIKIKICGITRPSEAVWINRFMPDYIGFVFAPSRRRVTPECASTISRLLAGSIKRVGVFVNPSEDYILRVLNKCPLDIIQLHGEESPDFCSRIGLPVWKAFRIGKEGIPAFIREYPVEAVLLDGYHPVGYGGMNRTFPWEYTRSLDTRGKPVVLAGGLNSENIERALSIVKPYAVDVSSGVETEGVKDEKKVRKFIEKVRGSNA